MKKKIKPEQVKAMKAKEKMPKLGSKIDKTSKAGPKPMKAKRK